MKPSMPLHPAKIAIFPICFLFIIHLSVYAQNENTACKLILLSPQNDQFSINTSLYYLEDQNHILTIHDILLPDIAARFKLNTKHKLNFGYSSSAYWIKFCIRNTLPKNNDWLLEIDYVPLDSIEFFTVKGENQITVKHFGDMFPFSHREMDFRTFAIPLNQPDTLIHTYYARIITQGSMQFPMNVYREETYYKKYILTEIYYGIFYGIMLALIVYNLCVYFALKDISFLHYVLLIVSTTLFQALMSGHVFQYFLGNYMWLNNNMLPSSIAFSEFCIILFARSFLNVKKNIPGLNRVLNWALVFSLIFMVAVFFMPYKISVQIAAHTVLLYIALSLFSGIICLVNGYRAARLYILAFALLFVGGVAASLTAIGLFPKSEFTSHGMEVGSMMQWIFLSLALIDYYKLSIAEKDKALHEINLMQKKSNEDLERKVKERTNEIEEKNDELNQQKEELQTTLDYLRKTQEQLIESEKMAALGGLVAGVAHEISTPVGIGVTAASGLQEEIQRMSSLYQSDKVNRKDFKEFLDSADCAVLLIHKNLERMAELIQSFKQVSVDQVSEQLREFNFKSYLDDIIRSLYPKFKHQEVIFNIECDEGLELNSYPGAYAQIFTNLILNSISHGFREKDKGIISIRVSQKNNRLMIEYMDDGKGIGKKDLPHIFEPFYTSDKQQGTGLGLNIVYNLVKQKLHGSISCESESGNGVLFRLDLPVE